VDLSQRSSGGRSCFSLKQCMTACVKYYNHGSPPRLAVQNFYWHCYKTGLTTCTVDLVPNPARSWVDNAWTKAPHHKSCC
jgi:hypothetical protein